MAQNDWAVVSEAPIARTAGTGWEVVEQNPIQEKQSAFRQIADVPLGIAKGAVQGVRMIADAFGAGSDTSNTIKSAETYLADLMSAQAKNDQQEISRIMKDAEDKGVLDQVKAGIKAFTVAPVDTLSSALGTAAPVIAGALGAKVLGAGALLTTGVSALTGAGMGAGVVKGAIYEETKRTLKEAGASEQDAESRAKLAQEYGGKNLDQILLGTVLGGAAAVGPLEKGAAGILARRILGKTEGTEAVAGQAAKGALRRRAEAGLLEAVPEAVQAGQEQVAQNIALQREGFDVPTFRGAFSAATMEAIAGGGLGATLGGGKPEAPAPVAPPVAPPPVAPEAGLEQLTPQQKQELERQRAGAERPKTTEELLAGIQTGAPTTPEDVARIRDQHETAVIEGLLAQDAEMKRANEWVAAEMERVNQLDELRNQARDEEERQAIERRILDLGIKDVDQRVRETRILSRVQDLIDRNIPFASTAINDINQKFGVINEAPLNEEERARVENIMGMVNTFTNFVNLPVLAPKPVDQFAENQVMEALIKERTERGQAQPLRTTPPAPSPSVQKAPVSQGVVESPAVRPTSGVEPSAPQNRQLVTPPVTPPAPPVAPVLVVEAAEPVEPSAEPLGTRKEAQTFGKAIGATQPYPGELRGRVNLPAQKAAKEGNFQGVLSALEKSKNVIVAEIAKRARALGTKIVIDDDAEETYTGPSTLMRQMSIDGAKMHLEALNKIRELAPKVDALPDKAELSYAIRGETINAVDGGESAGRMYLEDIAKMGHSMFAPLPIGEGKFKTKEDFKRLQKAYEDLTSEYGENELQLTSTGSAQMTGVAGVYDANTDTIRVPEYTAKREEVLSHEIVHAQTVQAIANPSLRQKPIVARLNKLYEHVKKELEVRPGFSNSLRRAPYGIQSIQEFVAEGMGNPAFQFLLKKIKYENTSAWDSFVQTIANLIGVKRDTAFTELLSIYSDLTTEQKSAPKAPAVKAPAPKADAPVTPVANVEEQTTPTEEAKDIAEPTIRSRLKEIAKNLGVLVFETGDKYSSGNGVVNIPTEDKQVEGAQSPEHVFAHELGHAILQNRSMSFNGMPNAEVAKWITGWDSIKAISKAFRPEVHNHKLPKFRRHANKPNEIIADALGSFLLGNSSKQDIAPLIKALNLNDFDLGIKARTVAAPKAEAPVVEATTAEAPAAPPTLDTTGIKKVKGRHPQIQAAAQLLQDKKMTREEFEKYVDAYKSIEEIEADKLLPPTSEQKMNETVNADKRDRINVPVEDGTKVGLRMDLPARERGGSVVSIHEGKSGKLTVGKLMGFRSTGWLKDVTFEVRSQEKGLAVATGAAKAPQQTVEGTWQNLGPEETYARVKELMKDPAWKQIGFDPSRHGYFYDRKTTQPVVSASEMYQVGQFLLAKDVKYAPKTDFLYSLGGAKAQRSNFEQTLRTLLNKFGLKDVGLSIIEEVQDAGSYAQQLIRIADRADNPIRTLRHEAIHALRELGFFTEAQWSSLSKMAKDKWIDQYLKQKNADGKPLKAGEESRYDAYMREYNGDMEKITEEAVADAFADFDASKPPAGMLQSLVKRMKDLFQSIKSALTKVESVDQIFGKVEEGKLKPGKKAEAGERKSLGGVSLGQQALETISRMGMGVKPPEPGKVAKLQKILRDAGENPAGTKASAKAALTKWLDAFETMAFSGDAAFNNKVTSSVIADMKENEEVLGKLLELSQSQAVNADNVVSRGLIEGSIEYNEEMKKYQSVKKDENFAALIGKLEELSTKYGTSPQEMERIAHAYLVAKRLPGIIKRNEELDTEIAAEEATAKPDRKSIDKWKSLKVYVSPEQEAMVDDGVSLGKTIPELSQISDMWNAIRKNNIAVMVESGLYTPEYAQQLWDNMDYVPYYREEQLEADAGPTEFIRGLQVKAKEFQLKGSGAAVNDVFENMMLWSQYAMNRAIRADKARRMIDVAKDIDIGDRKMAEQVKEEKRGMNIVRVFRDGKQELWDLADPMFVPAFTSIQNVSIPMFKWAAKVADLLRNSVVLYPMFSVAQVPQDSFAAMFTSGLKPQHALKIPYLAVKEFIKTLNKTSATHNELVKYGVVGARNFSAEVMRQDAEIFAGLKPPKGGWNKTKDFLEHIAMSADNAVRQAVYEAAQQQGVSKQEALEKAFEIFNVRRRGTSKALNLAGQTIPFFYAYLAAQRVAYRTITGVGTSPTERKAALQTLAATSAAVFTLSMLYAMMVADDEDYAETPAAVRDRTLTIPGTGGVRIPLRADFFLFPKIIAEHTYLMLTDQGYEDGAKFRRSMRDGLINAIASPTPLPQIAKPALEVLINYSFFDGKPVIGTFEKQKDLERQFNDSTSEFSKLLGKTGFVSPIAADHLIRGMLGSAGGLALYGTNMFLHSDPDVPRPEMSWKEAAAALPGTSGFLKRPQESALKNDFFVLRDEVEKAVNTFNDIKTRSPEGIEAFLEDEKKMARLMLGKPVDKINRELSKIRKVMTQITNMPESQMSAEDKSENIRQLREMEREILKSVDVKALREMAKI